MTTNIQFSVGDWNKGAKNFPKDVKAIQSLLTNISTLTKNKAFNPKGIDGKIAKPPKESNTVKAIIAFQSTIMNNPDGLIEPRKKTIDRMLKAMNQSQFPGLPNFSSLDTAAKNKMFGKFKYRRTKNSSGKVLKGSPIIREDNWEKNNIILVEVPHLYGIPIGFDLSATTGRMSFHKSVAGQLTQIWQAWHDAGLINRIKTYDGAYNPRLARRSSSTLSPHAWGTAFDINKKTNDIGMTPAMLGDEGCVRELVQIANAYGFFWGGHFSHPDGMHFEASIIGAFPSPIA